MLKFVFGLLFGLLLAPQLAIESRLATARQALGSLWAESVADTRKSIIEGPAQNNAGSLASADGGLFRATETSVQPSATVPGAAEDPPQSLSSTPFNVTGLSLPSTPGTGLDSTPSADIPGQPRLATDDDRLGEIRLRIQRLLIQSRN